MQDLPISSQNLNSFYYNLCNFTVKALLIKSFLIFKLSFFATNSGIAVSFKETKLKKLKNFFFFSVL